MLKSAFHISLWLLLIGCAKDSSSAKPDIKNPSPTENYTFLPSEVRPLSSISCFAGAYYRKVVSSRDKWIGISGVVTLPAIKFDESRSNLAKPKQYLDNPSIYMGGNMGGQETDIGLTWEVIRNEEGTISQERLAFRPFLRRTAHASGQPSLYVNAPAQASYYWYPDDQVEMSLEVIGNGQLKFVVQREGKSYETVFEAAGYSFSDSGEFKRVNAIDQVSNEGKPAQKTNTSVSNSIWHKTDLIRMQNGSRIVVPMHNGRMTSMVCPQAQYISIQQSAQDKLIGAEKISIDGKGF